MAFSATKLFLEAANTVDSQDLQGHFGALIFMGIFVIVAIVVGIWWMQR